MGEVVGDWLRLLDRRYPPHSAASWDNVGLQVGDPDWPVARVLVTLDVTSRVVDEAAEVDATLVVAHHPLLFRPLTTLTPDSAAGRVALSAARRAVAITATHTNLDVARDGTSTSEPIADVLALTDRRPLTTELTDGADCKLVTFVPPDALDVVLDAMAEAGAGRIGDYERCAFRVGGTGTFRPTAGAQPYSGTVGEIADEDEQRVEMVVPRHAAGAVVAALRASHPYEEVAYDLYGLVGGGELGFGVLGRLAEPTTLAEVAERLREGLPAPGLRTAGEPDRAVRTVAAVGGAGESLIDAARAAGADVLVTGDLRHHVALDALELGLSLIDAGHHATESAAIPRVVEALAADGRAEGLDAPVVASATPTAPWR